MQAIVIVKLYMFEMVKDVHIFSKVSIFTNPEHYYEL